MVDEVDSIDETTNQIVARRGFLLISIADRMEPDVGGSKKNQNTASLLPGRRYKGAHNYKILLVALPLSLWLQELGICCLDFVVPS